MTLTADAEHTTTLSGADLLRELLYCYGSRYYQYHELFDTDAAAAFIAHWVQYISDRQESLNRIYAGVIAQYDLLDTYNKYKTDEMDYDSSTDTEYGHVLSRTGDVTTEDELGSAVQHDITTYESTAYRADTKDTKSGTDTHTVTHDTADTESGTDTVTRSGKDTRTINENGYDKSPIDQIAAEIELRAHTDIQPMIIDGFAKKYLFSMPGRC